MKIVIMERKPEKVASTKVDGTRKAVKNRITRPHPMWLPGDKKILRVFPERTAMTPDDSYVYIGHPPLACCIPEETEVDEVHISVTFSWHKKMAENQLIYEWKEAYPNIPVKLGGPVYDSIECPAGHFKGGLYLKHGVTLTSRGCPNNCWFCFVPKREGKVVELPITPGFHVQDNNLTACSKTHCENVFKMLDAQGEMTNFSGGLECARMLARPWFVDLLTDSRKHTRQIFVAFDDEARDNVTRKGIALLRDKGFTRRQIRCFVLAGYPGNAGQGVEVDTIEKAINRCERVLDWGALPFMMLYRGEDFTVPATSRSAWKTVQHEVSGPWSDPGWRKLQNEWTAPAVMFSKYKLDDKDKGQGDIDTVVSQIKGGDDDDDMMSSLLPDDCAHLQKEDNEAIAQEMRERQAQDRIRREREEKEEAGQTGMF